MSEVILVIRGATLGRSTCVEIIKSGFNVLIVENNNENDIDEADRFCQEINRNHRTKSCIDFQVSGKDLDENDYIGEIIKYREFYTDDEVVKVIRFFVEEDGSVEFETVPVKKQFPFECAEDERFQDLLEELNDKYRFTVIDKRTMCEIKSDLKRYLIYRESEGTPLTHEGNIINNFHVSAICSEHRPDPYMPITISKHCGRLELIPETL